MKKILFLFAVMSLMTFSTVVANNNNNGNNGNDKGTGADLDHGVIDVPLPGVPPIVVPTGTPKN